MNRKLAYSAAPLIFAVLILGVKWRAEHPTPTKEDLEYRELMLGSSKMEVAYGPGFPKGTTVFSGQISIIYQSKPSSQDLETLADNFYLSPHPLKKTGALLSEVGTIFIRFYLAKPKKDEVEGAYIIIDFDKCEGKSGMTHPNNNKAVRRLHPVTVKGWMEILLSHPRIGPELRARMK